MAVLEVTVTYADGKRETLPERERDDEIGRKVTDKRVFDLMARDDVQTVKVEPVTRYSGGQRGTYR